MLDMKPFITIIIAQHGFCCIAWYGVLLVATADGTISIRGTERNYGVQNWARSFTPDKVKPWFKRIELALEQLEAWRMGSSVLLAYQHHYTRYFRSTTYSVAMLSIPQHTSSATLQSGYQWHDIIGPLFPKRPLRVAEFPPCPNQGSRSHTQVP